MKKHLRKSRLHLQVFWLLFSLAITGLPLPSSGQIIIKERLELTESGSSAHEKQVHSQQEIPKAVYPQYSGKLILTLDAYTRHELLGEWALYEESYGQLSGIIDWKQGLKVELDGFEQWQRLAFYLRRMDKEGTDRHILNSRMAEKDEKTYISFEKIIWDDPDASGIYFPSPTLELIADSTKPTIPTQEVFDRIFYNLDNIYKPLPAFTVPDSGLLRARIQSVRGGGRYELHLEQPFDTLLAEDVRTRWGDIIEIGQVTPSDKVRLYIKSDHEVVRDIPIYPYRMSGESYPWIFKRFLFEGWTDLNFDDIKMELILGPHPQDPERLKIELEPDTLAPGDTASVYIYGLRRNGRNLYFWDDHTFDVEVISNKEYITLLHPNGKDTSDTFEGITQDFKVIANNPNLPKVLASRVRATTKADGYLIKDKLIEGTVPVEIKKLQLEPCKGMFPDIEVEGVRQPDDWEECDGDEGGTTEIKTEHYTADFQACFSETHGRWKAELTSVDAKVKYGLCPGSAEDKGLVVITGPVDSKITESSYCAINEKIKATIKSNEEGGEVEVYYPTATLAHERKHVEQIRDKIDMHVIGRGGLYESLESEAYTLEKDKAANASEAQNMLQSYFDYLWNNAKYDIHEELKEIAGDNSWEGDARKAALPHLEALLQQIRDRADQLGWKSCSE